MCTCTLFNSTQQQSAAVWYGDYCRVLLCRYFTIKTSAGAHVKRVVPLLRAWAAAPSVREATFIFTDAAETV